MVKKKVFLDVFSNFSRSRFSISRDGKRVFENYEIVKNFFKEADETLEFSLSKIILDGPKEDLDLHDKYSTCYFFSKLFNI